MPLMDGIEVLQAFRKEEIEVPVIMISGHGTVETAVQAIKKGAFSNIRTTNNGYYSIHLTKIR